MESLDFSDFEKEITFICKTKTTMLKAALIVTILYFFPLLAPAQNKAFIEVVVEDTMQLEAEEIIYAINYAPWYTAVDSAAIATSDVDTMTATAVPDEPAVDWLKDVRDIILLMKLDTLKEFNYAVSNRNDDEHPALLIRFRSVGQLKEFVGRIRNLKNVIGSIARTNSSKEKAAEKILFQRLFEQAKAKAETLAQIAGKKLGGVNFLKEKETKGGWTMYPPLSVIPGWHTEVSTVQDGKIIISRGIIVQFSWH